MGPRKKSSKIDTGNEGLKDPKVSYQECVASKNSGLKEYQSIMDHEDLSLIRIAYYIPREFKLELPSPNARINNPPPS